MCEISGSIYRAGIVITGLNELQDCIMKSNFFQIHMRETVLYNQICFSSLQEALM
jgi:hypothetical protein